MWQKDKLLLTLNFERILLAGMKKTLLLALSIFSALYSVSATEYTVNLNNQEESGSQTVLKGNGRDWFLFAGNWNTISIAKNVDYVEYGITYESNSIGVLEFDISSLKDVDLSTIKQATLNLYVRSFQVAVYVCSLADNSELTGVPWNDSQSGLFPYHYTQVDEANIITKIESATVGETLAVDVLDYISSIGTIGDSEHLGFVFLTDSSAKGITNFIGYSGTGTPVSLTLSTEPIPEPSTYAAIFGALALGFAAYRKSK